MLIRGGTVIDPAHGVSGERDVALASGRILAVARGLEPGPGEEVIDARGLLVVPGLIDLRVHVFYGASHYGIEPDPHCLATGSPPPSTRDPRARSLSAPFGNILRRQTSVGVGNHLK